MSGVLQPKHQPLTRCVESRCGAVTLGRTYLFPPLSSGGALVVQPWLRFHIHRVAGGGRPPPAPTERGVRISRTTLFGSWFTAFTAICSSFVSMVSCSSLWV